MDNDLLQVILLLYHSVSFLTRPAAKLLHLHTHTHTLIDAHLYLIPVSGLPHIVVGYNAFQRLPRQLCSNKRVNKNNNHMHTHARCSHSFSGCRGSPSDLVSLLQTSWPLLVTDRKSKTCTSWTNTKKFTKSDIFLSSRRKLV